jgi:hypothetical protein
VATVQKKFIELEIENMKRRNNFVVCNAPYSRSITYIDGIKNNEEFLLKHSNIFPFMVRPYSLRIRIFEAEFC